ncbi:MAG: hypothetical protein K2X29_06335, partial [Candidatus Obscuribacterales bacterium]|nr:hypothetical protein [Candidatus Obscuribacterales bacterium]
MSRNRFIAAIAGSIWLSPMNVSVQPVFGAQPQQSQTHVAPVIHRNVQADRVTNPRFNGTFDRATSEAAARSFQSLPSNEHLYFVGQQINELPSKDVPATASEPTSTALAMQHDGSMFMMAPKEADIVLSDSTAHFNKGVLGYIVKLGSDTAVCNLSGLKKDDAVFKTSTGNINVPLGTAVFASSTTKDIKDSPLAQLLELDGITAVGSDGNSTIYRCPISYSVIAELAPQIRAGMSPQADPA